MGLLDTVHMLLRRYCTYVSMQCIYGVCMSSLVKFTLCDQ